MGAPVGVFGCLYKLNSGYDATLPDTPMFKVSSPNPLELITSVSPKKGLYSPSAAIIENDGSSYTFVNKSDCVTLDTRANGVDEPLTGPTSICPFISKSVPLITGYFNPLSAKIYVLSNLDSDKNVDSYVYSVWSKIASITKSNLIAGLKSCAYNLPPTVSIPNKLFDKED